MSTSVEVMVLVTIGVISTVYAFYLDVRRGAENDRFLDWLRTERKTDWDALSRADRFLSIRAVETLRRGSLAGDPEFHSRYQATRHGTRFATAMTVAGAVVALLIVGTSFLGWNW